MIIAVLIGREGSVGFPGKNVYPVLKRPLMAYPLLAALNSKYVDKVFVSTDSKKIAETGKQYGADIIDRPAFLATSSAISEDVFAHAYKYVKDTLKINIDLIALLFCNAPMILPATIDRGVEILRERPEIDSTITVSRYNMWSPIRARRIDKEGLLSPFIPFEKMRVSMDSNRDSQGDVYFHDCGVSVVRPGCLENIKDGILPQKWMGRKIYPLVQKGGLDIDYAYEVPLAESWLKENGFTEEETPYGKKQYKTQS